MILFSHRQIKCYLIIKLRTLSLGLLSVFTLLTVNPVYSTTFKIEVFKDDNLQLTGLGVVISPGVVMVYDELLLAGDTFVVTTKENSREVIWQQQTLPDSKLALLHVENMAAQQPSIFAKQNIGAEQQVNVIDHRNSLRSGITLKDTTAPVTQHTILLERNEFGAPIFNRCGELIGLSSHSKQEINKGLPLLTADFQYFIPVAELVSQLKKTGIHIQIASAVCAELNYSSTSEPTAKQTSIEDNNQYTAPGVNTLRQLDIGDSSRTHEKQTQVQKQAPYPTATEEQASKLTQPNDKAVESTNNQQYLWLVVALLFIAGILATLWHSLKPKTVPEKASPQVMDFSSPAQLEKVEQPDLLLASSEPDTVLQIKILAGTLNRAKNGIIIGRSINQSDYVIPDESVSRAHCQLENQHGQIYLNDLHSANGTHINSIPLTPGVKHAISDGDTITVGKLTLTAHLIHHEKKKPGN